MKLRKIDKRFVPRVLIISAMIIAILFYFLSTRSSDSFLKYANKDFYKPLNDTDNRLGLIGKINAYLKDALADSVPATSVFDKYPHLKILAPLNDSFATYKDTRLVDYIPRTSSEKYFYYNSQFSKIIEKQNKDFSEEYFKIKYSWDHTSIESIVVDEVKLYTILSNEAWRGTVTFQDPTLQWDSARKFVVYEGLVVPLFTCQPGETPEVIEMGQANLLTPENILSAYWEKAHALSLRIPGKNSFLVQQTADSIIVNVYDSSTRIIVDGKTFSRSRSFKRQLNNSNLFFTLQKGELSIPITITDKSPYQQASQVANGAYAGNRIEIDSNYADLFSKQIINGIKQHLKNSDTSKEFKLSYDAVQAKYYENIFKNTLVPRFKQDLNETDKNYDINLTMADLATGEIIAAPFYNNLFENYAEEELLFKTNYNLKSSTYEVGSTFKPILSAACVLNYPALLNYDFTYGTQYADKGNKVYTVNGLDIHWSMAEPQNYFNNCNSFSDFLARSHDGYPLGLVMNAFVGNNDVSSNGLLQNNIPASLRGNTQFLRYNAEANFLGIQNIQNTYLCKTLEFAFGLPIYKTSIHANFFPGNPSIEPAQIIPEPSSLFGLDREGLSEKGDFNYDGDLRPWILGQGNLDVSLFDLCQAYIRLLTKRKINLKYTFDKSENDLIYSNIMLPDSMAFMNKENREEKLNVWNNFLTQWSIAQDNPNATFEAKAKGKTNFDRARNNFPASLNEGGGLQVFFKTGTPSNAINTGIGNELVIPQKGISLGKDDVYFVMAITNSMANILRNNTKGIVMIVHASRKKIFKNKEEAASFKNASGLWGADLLKDFLTEDLIKNIVRFNKARF